MYTYHIYIYIYLFIHVFIYLRIHFPEQILPASPLGSCRWRELREHAAVTADGEEGAGAGGAIGTRHNDLPKARRGPIPVAKIDEKIDGYP